VGKQLRAALGRRPRMREAGSAARRIEQLGIDRSPLRSRRFDGLGEPGGGGFPSREQLVRRVLPGGERHRTPQQVEPRGLGVLGRLDTWPEARHDARPPSNEGIVGQGDQEERLRPHPADERREPPPQGPNLPVRRGAALGEDDQGTLPRDFDKAAKVGSRAGGAALPEPGRARAVGSLHRPPEEVGVLAAQHVAASHCGWKPKLIRAHAEGIAELLREQLLELGLRDGADELAGASDARARDGMHLDPRQESPDAYGEEGPPGALRELLGEAREEAREEHVIAGREAHAVLAVTPEAAPEVEQGRDHGHIGLAPVGHDDQRARLEAEAMRPHGHNSKRRVRVRPHAQSYSVVERSHVGSMAAMARLVLRDPAPPFELPGIDGEKHSLGDYSGQPVAVVFSCVHCPYVVAWEDRLNDVARDYEGRAGLVAINSNAGYLGDGLEDMERRAGEKAFAFPFLYDETQGVASAYGAVRTPEVFLFDSEHRLVYHGTPDSDYQDAEGAEPYLRNALEAVLDGGEIDPAEVPPVGCTIKWRS
jgi:peroxiredoxin